MRVFKSKFFDRFARKEGLTDVKLCGAVNEAEQGKIDADYGGGLIKQRIARTGQGKSGGYRAILCFCLGHRAFFVHGFAKNQQDNINERQEKQFKALAEILLNLAEDELEELLVIGDYLEVFCNEKN